MAWSAIVGVVSIDAQGVAVPVTFNNDDGRTSSDVLRFTTESPEQVNAEIDRRLNKLVAQEAILASIAPGPFTPPPAPEPPPPPTDAELQDAAYQQALAVRQKVLDAISAGAIKAGDTDDVSSIALVQSAYALIQPSIQDAITNATGKVNTVPMPSPVEVVQ